MNALNYEEAVHRLLKSYHHQQQQMATNDVYDLRYHNTISRTTTRITLTCAETTTMTMMYAHQHQDEQD
jgi:hypothetical protein